MDLGVLSAAAYDDLAGLLEKNAPVHLGVVPGTGPGPEHSTGKVIERVLRWLEMIGLDPESAASLVLTPACGLADTAQDGARQALRLLQSVATELRS